MDLYVVEVVVDNVVDYIVLGVLLQGIYKRSEQYCEQDGCCCDKGMFVVVLDVVLGYFEQYN